MFKYSTLHSLLSKCDAMSGHWQHNRLLTSTLIKHLMLFITWLQNNYIRYSKALQNMVWWIAAGSQKLLRCTPNTNSTMYSEQSSHVVSNHHLIFRKVNLLSFILAEDTHLYHSSGWIRNCQWSTLILSKFMQQTHTKLYSSTALTLF